MSFFLAAILADLIGITRLESSLYVNGHKVETVARVITTIDGTNILSMVAHNAGKQEVLVRWGASRATRKFYHLRPGQSMRLFSQEIDGTQRYRERQESLEIYVFDGGCWVREASGLISVFRRASASQ
jgi:hypothetical protein